MAQKTCYVKCVSNEQAQQLRGELVGAGFVENVFDTAFNGNQNEKYQKAIVLYGLEQDVDEEDRLTIGVHSLKIAAIDNTPLLYTLTPDENLTEAAVKIKELFDNQD